MAQIWEAETYVTVVDAGGVSAAARRLGRSQPTVSRQLAALEARLGVRLLERSTRRVRMTAAGRTYFERCKALLELLREADELVTDMSGTLKGRLRLSVPPTYARRRIAPLLPAFLDAYPGLSLELVLTAERAHLVAEPFDLVVRLGPLPDSTLRCRTLSQEHFVLCASPAHLKAHGTPAAVGDLANRRCLVTETFGVRNRWQFRHAERRTTVAVTGAIVSDDLGLLHEATRAGAGLSVLPAYLVADDLRAGTLVRVLPRQRLPSFRAYAVLPSARHVPRRVRALLSFLAARLRASATVRTAS